ncbi:hypothetical protein D3C71_1935320 [compost metagenome]
MHDTGGQVHLLAAVDRAQAFGLKIAGLAGGGTFGGGVGDLAGGLIDAVLAGLNCAQTRVVGGATGDFHVRTPLTLDDEQAQLKQARGEKARLNP